MSAAECAFVWKRYHVCKRDEGHDGRHVCVCGSWASDSPKDGKRHG